MRMQLRSPRRRDLEDGRREDPDLAILVAENEPAEPFARLLRASLPVKHRHVLTAADDAEIVGIIGEVPRELAVGELVIHHYLIHRKRQRPRKALDELSVFAFVGALEEMAPEGVSDS